MVVVGTAVVATGVAVGVGVAEAGRIPVTFAANQTLLNPSP
jgi:hypothetical protein